MSEEPTVSVVIPTYDRPEMLQRAVESVVQQTYDSVELLVVDDHSPTPASETLERIETDTLRSVECIRHDENRGGSAARTTGIEAASGAWVAFLDDDDEWKPTKLEKQVERVTSASGDVVLVYTGIRQVGEDGSTNAVKTPAEEGNALEQLLYGNFIGSYSAVMVRLKAIDAVGPPDDRFPSWQDWEWYLRLAQYGDFISVPEALVIRHNNHEQMSSNFETKLNTSYPLILGTGLPIAKELDMERRFEASVLFELGRAAAGNNQFGSARHHLIQSIKFDPLSTSTWLYLILTSCGKFSFYPSQVIKRNVLRKLLKLLNTTTTTS